MLNVFIDIMESRTWQASGLFPTMFFAVMYCIFLYVLLYIAYVEENKTMCLLDL